MRSSAAAPRLAVALLVVTAVVAVTVEAPHPLAAASARLDAATRRAVLLEEPMARLDLLARTCSDDPHALTRPYLGPAHARAAALLAAWFTDAGLTDVWIDAVGNVRGRAGGGSSGSPATLLLGSHFDTVPGAGRFDGALGLVAAVAAVKAARAASSASAAGQWPSQGRALEVIAFADEEGARFGTTLLGSSALAGSLVGSGALEGAVDGDGITLGRAIAVAAEERARAAGHPLAGVRAPAWDAIAAARPPARPAAVAAAVADAALPRTAAVAYVEAHSEQGSVLEGARARVAAVAGIASQARWRVAVVGAAGHAGAVPMAGRADAGAAAAAAVGLIEEACGGGGGGGGGRARAWTAARPHGGSPSALALALFSTRAGAALAARWPAAAARLAGLLDPLPPPPTPTSPTLVCTVGAMAFHPGAPNVIPGGATFTVDVRDASAAGRDAATARARAAVASACAHRGVTCTWTRTHAAPEAVADEAWTARVEASAVAARALMEELDDSGVGGEALLPRRLTSGAGHDASALAPRPLPWAMVFLRDKGGVSHTPAEDVRPGDVAAAGAVLWGVVEGFLCGGRGVVT